MQYSDLTARLNAVLADDHSTDTDWANYLPEIIQDAELRCYRDVDFLALRVTATTTFTAGTSSYAAPTDWLIGHAVRLTDIGVTLARRDTSFVLDYGGNGQPKYWAEPTQGTIQLAPTPSITYNALLSYQRHPTPLSASNTTTWLSLNCPDLFFAACMVMATGYIKNWGAQADDPRMALSWEQQYQKALVGVRNEEMRRKGEPAFDASLNPIATSNIPKPDRA